MSVSGFEPAIITAFANRGQTTLTTEVDGDADGDAGVEVLAPSQSGEVVA